MTCYLEDSPVVTARSDFPELVVEWLPVMGPLSTDGDWCDITEYTQAITTVSGRQYELDQFGSGRCTLSLVATTRLFDSEWTSGPFYPYLIPMKQVRVSAVWAGVRYGVWRGYVTRWGRVVEQDEVFRVTVDCQDGFHRLEQIKLPSSAWALEVQRDEPSLWFRLGETDTARATDSSDGGNYGLYDNVVQGAEGLVPNDSDGSVEISNDETSADMRVTIQNPSLISGYPFTVSGIFKLPTNPTYARYLFAGIHDIVDSNPSFFINVSASAGYQDKLRATILNGGSQVDAISADLVADDLPHHFLVTFTASAYTLYVDGVSVASGSHAVTWPGNPPNGYSIGNTPDVTFGAFGFKGFIDEVCVWNGTTIAADRAAAHSLAAKSGWDNDDTGARVTRFLNAIEWPTTLRSIETGISVLGPARWGLGDSALGVLQGWADTEYGQFFTDPDGRIVWRSRHYRYLNAKATTSQATFGDKNSGEPLQYVADSYADVQDETLIRNPVRADREGGISVEVKDQNLIDTKYGHRAWASPSTQDRLDSAVRDRAIWLLARYKEQTTRLASMKVNPRRPMTGDAWIEVLGLGIGDRITVERKPLNQGNQIVMDQWIEAISHRIIASQRLWETTYVGSPIETQTYLVLDDAVKGLLDTGTLAY